MDAESIRIETDEDGFHLIVEEASDGPTGHEGERFDFIIVDPEALYDHVKAAIGPWLYERDMARRTRPFECDPDESAGAYELSDPKHPDFHSVHADIWDMREKNPDEYEYLREESKREKAGEA